MKPRKCSLRGCREPATMGNAVNAWCSIEHGAALAKELRGRKEKREARETKAKHRKDKRRVKPDKHIRGEAQDAVNAYVRARDRGKPCISCLREDDGTWQRQAGHYKAVGAGGGSPLRYEPDNIHVQCVKCNKYDGGGKHPGYRPELIRRIGLDRVLWLEGPHPPKHYTREDLEAIKVEYRRRKRELDRLSASE